MKTFLTLTNDAIAEAKVTLDPLTPDNFATPTRTILYTRFKTWVNRAYKELMLKRNKWQFRMERGNLVVWPRLHLTNVTVIPAIGDVVQGATSGTSATVIKVHTFEDVESDTIQEVTLSLDILDDLHIYDFYLTESINILSPTPGTDIANVKGAGTYNITDQVVNLRKVDANSIRFFDPEQPNDAVPYPVVPVIWDDWVTGDQQWARYNGRPTQVTEAPDGNLIFYPHPDKNYIMNFTFYRKLPEMVNYNDVPSEIPEDYQDYLMWKAIADFADYDSNQRLFSRANKNLEQYIYWLERDELPDPYIGPNRFYRS